MKRMAYLVIGLLSLVLGTCGTMLPILPTVPFYLLAAFCFARSSERLHRWFIGTDLYKKNLESYAKGEGMTAKVKAKILFAITLSIGFSLWLTREVMIAQCCLILVWICLMLYFLCKVKTRKAIK